MTPKNEIELLKRLNPVPPGSVERLAARRAEGLLARLRADEVAVSGSWLPRRWRRRYVPMVAVVAAVAAAAGAYAASTGTSPPGLSLVKSGRSDGATWMINAADSGDGRYCMEVDIGGSPAATKCGTFYLPGPGGVPVRLGWTSNSHGALPFVAGAVADPGVNVTIQLSDGSTRMTRAIVPGYALALAPGIDYFFVPTPAGAEPVAITARDDSGTIVATWTRGSTQSSSNSK